MLIVATETSNFFLRFDNNQRCSRSAQGDVAQHRDADAALEQLQRRYTDGGGLEKLLFDFGRGSTIRLYQKRIPLGTITEHLITHLRRRDCCRDCIFRSIVQFSLSLKVELFVSIFRLASLLPQFVSSPCDLHLLGICHCDLLRTGSGTTKKYGYLPSTRSAREFPGRQHKICGLRVRPKIS